VAILRCGLELLVEPRSLLLCLIVSAPRKGGKQCRENSVCDFDVPPSGPGWLHEIKHDGFRILARRNSAGVQLITRAGNDFSRRFPLMAIAVGKLAVRSCLIDGEAIVCDAKGLAVFELIRRHGTIASAVHCAFDLLELDGKDLRREPIEKRKELLVELLGGSQVNLVFNECFEEEGAIVYREACKLGCEGIVSKRLGSSYRSGRSPHWVKVKNPKARAVKREAEEDWGSPRWIKNHKLTAVTRGDY